MRRVRWEGPCEDPVADPFAEDPVDRQERAGEGREQCLFLAAQNQAYDAVYAFLDGPDAKRRVGRPRPDLAVGAEHPVAKRRIDEAGRDDADVNAVAAEL